MIHNFRLKKYWDGNSWENYVTWITTDTTGEAVSADGPSWTYDFTALDDRQSGDKYIVASKAIDKAGNEQDSFTLGTSSISFIVDYTAPQSGVIYPVGQYENSIDLISGTCSDIPGTGGY